MMYLRICGSFKSRKIIGSDNNKPGNRKSAYRGNIRSAYSKSENCHIWGRSAKLKKNIRKVCKYWGFGFAEFILDRPPLPAKFMYNMKNLRLNKKSPVLYMYYSELYATVRKVRKLRYQGWTDEIFTAEVFHESSSPKPLKIALRSFQIFRTFAEIFASQGAPLVSKIPGANLPTVSTTPVAK